MAQTKAFTKFIGPFGSDTSEGNLVNESSPAWVLTFVRWNVRDTLRAIPESGVSADLLAVRRPLVVENDCIQVTTTSNKSTLTPSMTAILKETDENYATAIAPGDFVFVNMLNWESHARAVVDIARSKNIGPINKQNQGFKGIYKVQSVRKTISVDQETGIKQVVIRVDGYAFTEFNNSIYYNPYLRTDVQGTPKDDLLFASNIHLDYKQLMTGDKKFYTQDLIKFLIQSFIGVGITDQGGTFAAGSPITANTHFYIPQQVGIFLGSPQAKSAKDVYNYLFGIQHYSTSQNQSLAIGMNPSNINPTVDNRFYNTNIPCEGQSIIKAEYWNCQNAWSILNQYTNAPLNEMYTCFRIAPNGSVMPTVVLRQIPFTTDFFSTSTDPTQQSTNVTVFSSLPRWQISSALITASDIGRDEAARINFVQFYVQPGGDPTKADGFIAQQTADRNYSYDINDVMRSGLRPHVITTNFDDLTILKDEKVGRKWALIMGDALIGGHLKMNGTIECIGIAQPIAVGDNLQYDQMVFHIEEVTHNCSINPTNGVKSFRTILKLSNGVSLSTTNTGIAYPEMVYTNAYNDRKNDYNNIDQNMPGVSEDQDVSYRLNNPSPTANQVKRPDAPFAQPGQIIKVNTPDESNE
jgi:hypothetical protein